MNEFQVLIVPSPALMAGRIALAFALVGIQYCVFRAGRGIANLLDIKNRVRKAIESGFLVFICVINLPLALFFLESLVSPRTELFYSPPPRYEWIIRPASYFFFVWSVGSILFVAGAPVCMAVFGAWRLWRVRRVGQDPERESAAVDLSKRRFIGLALAGVGTVPFAAAAYGAVVARSHKVVERMDVFLRGLPPGLDGLTVVQMSDIHTGMFMSETEIEECVKIANGLRPGLIVLTGDFVATRRSQVIPFMSAMSQLKARYGVYGCLGNHDMFTDSESSIQSAFKQAGFALLRNENKVIEINGSRLNIIGVDFIPSNAKRRNPLAHALNGISLEGTTLLLAHNPNAFPEAAKAGIDLTLSGHTHGGQIGLSVGGMLITPVALATMFVAGHFKIGDSHLYVNRGIGTTGPPIRINAPPEITCLTLHPAAP
ncbi:MAG TPA: metallophosphoesterase [Blastocatellia bacterium]|nr:metallophosphoesterase [Blastocatellia bacterium]